MSRPRRVDNIRMDLKEMGVNRRNWVDSADTMVTVTLFSFICREIRSVPPPFSFLVGFENKILRRIPDATNGWEWRVEKALQCGTS